MEESRLLSYLNGELSEQESIEVEAWASSSKANRHCLEQIYYTLALAQRYEAYEEADTDAALAKFRSRVSAGKTMASQVNLPKEEKGSVRLYSMWKRYGVAVAAFFSGLVVASGILLGMYGSTSTYEVSTVSGQRARVILPDGTAVWLNGSTQLSYHSGLLAREREARLKGEAYFEVKKHAFKPFVVHSKGVKTKVLGTKFNVRARKDEHKVVTTLLQGSVEMCCNSHKENGQLLKPGQTMIVDTENHNSELLSYNRPEEVLLWIKGEFRFNDAPLGQIMESLSKVYNVKVTFSDPALKQERFTCLFKTDSALEDILGTLALTRHFSYEYSETAVLIKPID